jgi:aspartyl-tRNA(Asn)/glutamyl-tRNA(Gln) amidotransferase subunit A
MLDITIVSLAQALRQKKVSSLELTQQSLDAIKKAQHLNAVLSVNEEYAISRAKQADVLLAKQSEMLSPLCGIPIAHKDVFVTQDFPTTAASKILEGYQSPFDATVVDNLNQLGMVSVAKTNCDEFAMGSSNENSAYGAVKNPWDLSAVPGGSSGGSAVVVSARLLPAATGTDTGGSIRQPAAFCGITGIKPTYGVCSRYGMVAYASSLDQAGPMAQTAEDCALLLEGMMGFDDKDSTSLIEVSPINYHQQALARLALSTEKPLAGLKIGVPNEYFGKELPDRSRVLLDQALKTYESLGAERVAVALPRTHLSIPAYYIIAAAEASSNLSRFDGVRYGHRSKNAGDLDTLLTQSRTEGFGEEVKRRILTGTFVLSHGYYDAYYQKALQVRQLIRQDFLNAFQVCDLIFAPTAPSTAWDLGEKVGDPVAMYLADIFTLSVNLAGLPALAHPIGFLKAENGRDRPLGGQLIGRPLDELGLLVAAMAFQRETDWHQYQPAVFE